MFIDTHAHLMFKQFEKDIDAVIKKAKNLWVEKIINVGCDLKSSEQSVEMSKKYEALYATLGLHPYDSADANEELMEKWEKLIEGNKKIVAVGECGLDFNKAKVSKEVQEKAFRMQLDLAQKTGLPVIIHNRDADEDCLRILKDYNGESKKRKVEAVFHCFGSDISFARKVWYAGYMTSFTGIITYPTAGDLKEVVGEAPMDMFMIETDCPYLAPQQFRGQRNEPAYVVDVAKAIAEIKDLHIHEIERISTENALKFFLRMS